LGAFLSAQTPVYQGSGSNAASYEYLRKPGPAFVQQAAVSFPSADLALAFLKTSVGKWRACAGQTVNNSVNGQNQTWTFGNLVGDVLAITLVRTQQGGNGYACQHALSAALNVILDVSACATPISDQGARLAGKMTAAVTQQAN
jgi:hypothetical protein